MFTYGGISVPNIVLGGLSQSFLKSVERFLLNFVLFGLLLYVKHGVIWPWLLFGKWDVVFCINFWFRLHPTQNILQ